MKRQSAKSYAESLWQTWKKTPVAEHTSLLQAFLELLQTQRALKLMPRILDHVQNLEDKSAGLRRVKVAAAVDQNPDELKKQLIAALGPVAVDLTIDPKLIAGLKVQVGDELIDASVATRLQHLQQHLATNT